jgi:hypothetical protein
VNRAQVTGLGILLRVECKQALVQMLTLVLYGGRDRSLDDYRRLAQASDLVVVAAVPRPTLSIIELAPRGDAVAGAQADKRP